jgi:hypothetical protein
VYVCMYVCVCQCVFLCLCVYVYVCVCAVLVLFERHMTRISRLSEPALCSLWPVVSRSASLSVRVHIRVRTGMGVGVCAFVCSVRAWVQVYVSGSCMQNGAFLGYAPSCPKTPACVLVGHRVALCPRNEAGVSPCASQNC